jgi:hypothetical protein
VRPSSKAAVSGGEEQSDIRMDAEIWFVVKVDWSMSTTARNWPNRLLVRRSTSGKAKASEGEVVKGEPR